MNLRRSDRWLALILVVLFPLLGATRAANRGSGSTSQRESGYSYDRPPNNALRRIATAPTLAVSGSVTVQDQAVIRSGPSQVALVVASETDTAASGAGDSSSADQAESCDANSFTASTPVLLATGAEIPISTVKVGDKVLATDPQTGQTAGRPVTSIIVHSGEHTMVDVILADGSTLTATDHHPFWDATTATFTYADVLHTGDQLREANGSLLTITNVAVFDENVTAYNLTVNDIHTYYAGTSSVLVHNSCGEPTANNYRGRFTAENPDLPDGYQVHHALPQTYADLFSEEGVNVHETEMLRGVDPQSTLRSPTSGQPGIAASRDHRMSMMSQISRTISMKRTGNPSSGPGVDGYYGYAARGFLRGLGTPN